MIQTKLMQSSDGSYYVFWETPNAYGSRGLGMDKHHAAQVADAISRTGDPDAMPDHRSVALPPREAS